MKALCTWTDKLQFVSTTEAHSLVMDAKKPIGSDTAPTPKDLLLSALCGCTAMDVVSLMRKHKQPLEEFSVEAEAKVRAATPAVFTEILLTFRLKGAVDKDLATEAVRLSETQYCSVSAMLSRVVPIHYVVELNGEQIAAGQANFETHLVEPDQGIS
jgi:putative redox protein